NIVQFIGRIRFENQLLFSKRTQYPRIQEIFEVKIVRDSDNSNPTSVQALIDSSQFVQHAIVLAPLDQRINLVENDEERGTPRLQTIPQPIQQLPHSKSRKRDLLAQRSTQISYDPVVGP